MIPLRYNITHYHLSYLSLCSSTLYHHCMHNAPRGFGGTIQGLRPPPAETGREEHPTCAQPNGVTLLHGTCFGDLPQIRGRGGAIKAE